jgi:hypothetical protein
MNKNEFFLSIRETDDIVELNLSNADKKILNFINNNPPKVKVPYFKQPRISKEQLFEFSKREAEDFPDGQQGALKSYIFCREKEIYQHVLELRKITKKLIMAAESTKEAKSVLKQLVSECNSEFQ